MSSDSRHLVAALRHGWILIRDLRRRPEFRHFDVSYIQHLAVSMDKTRIEISGNGRAVRAISSHAFNVCLDTLLTPVGDESELEYCGHGTTTEALPQILRMGLHRMGRQYIHFTSHPQAVRHSNVIIHLDVYKYLQENPGSLFWTKNNTIVALGNRHGTVRPCFFKYVEYL